MKEPLVSICCIAYNHGRYIRDAINGFLMQKAGFPIEIIIHDDASADDTAGIIREYAAKYPDLITPILQDKNRYSLGRRSWLTCLLARARGKYIALCEGDDYWTDPDKLQKQVDFMEANPDYILCFTNYNEVDESGKIIKENAFAARGKELYTHRDMPIYAHALTRLFRNEHLDTLPESFGKAPGSDLYLLVWQSKFGKIRYQDYNSGSYRVTDRGFWSGKDDFEKQYMSFKTRYVILDILEKDMKIKFTRLLIGILTDMKKKARRDRDILLCKSLYRGLINRCGRERRSGQIGIPGYIGLRVSLPAYYYLQGPWRLFLKHLRKNKVAGKMLRLKNKPV